MYLEILLHPLKLISYRIYSQLMYTFLHESSSSLPSASPQQTNFNSIPLPFTHSALLYHPLPPADALYFR